MIALFNYNNVTCGIERETRGRYELAGACSIAANGAEMPAAGVAQNLNTIVTGNNRVAFAVKPNTATASSELYIARAAPADESRSKIKPIIATRRGALQRPPWRCVFTELANALMPLRGAYARFVDTLPSLDKI
jgi:hypothetical protein